MPETRAAARGKAKKKSTPAKAAPAQVSTRKWIYAAAVALTLYLAFQAYAPALNGPFVFDDTVLPYHLPNYPSALSAWVSGVRPLLMLSYWINYQLSQDPAGFHVTNVFIHVLNSFLVFFIIRKLLSFESTASPWLAAFGAAVFLLHPVQTESVSYIAGRSECLSVLFFLAAFAVFLYRPTRAISWQTGLAVLALFAAAVATKEHTLVLPALLLLTDYYWNPGFVFSGIRRNWRLYAPIALGAVAGGAFVARVLAKAPSAGFGIKDLTWYQYFFTQCRAFFVYLRLLVFPAGQNLDWQYPISHSLLEHGAIIGFIVILAAVAAAIYFRRRYPLASYGFLTWLLLMAPTSSFVPIKDPVAERRLYLPMIGILLLVTALLRRVPINGRKLAVALSSVVVALVFLTYQRNQVWASDIGVWEDAAHKSPGKARVHFQLGHTYYVNGRHQDAVTQYAEAARLEPPKYDLLYDWGLALADAGQPEQALAKLNQAARMEPSAQVYTQISMVYARQKQWPEALQALAQAEKIDPNYDMVYDNRGGIRANTNDLAGAVSDYQRALALNPSNDHARQMLDIVQRQMRAPR